VLAFVLFVQGIVVAEELLHCPQVAVFDTAFHSTIPPYAYMYALPYRLYEELGIRRYGMHGTSYRYLLSPASEILKKPKEELNAIFFHLGAGASVAAVKQGKCIDTSMGVTPLEGLVMATRCGDIDPAVTGILASQKGMDAEEIDSLMNKESGLYGLCGDKDMRSIVEAADAGSEKHKLALKVFIHRIRKYLGAYLVHLEGNVDALVFSAGIGERSAAVRSLVCEGLEHFGFAVDEQKNNEGKAPAREIQKDGSKIKVLVIPTDEELSIAQQTMEVVEKLQQAESSKL
jgi:acetate kinase